MSKYDLSVIIPAREEEFLLPTIQDVLNTRRAKTEVIVVADGEWPLESIPDHPDVTMYRPSVSIGQRAAINAAARMSTAKYVMKLDAHCRMGEGFDVKLMANCEKNWIVVPRLYNLHAFDWRCLGCGLRSHQGPALSQCGQCKGLEFEKVFVWRIKDGSYCRCMACQELVPIQPKNQPCSLCGESKGFSNTEIERRMTDSMRFDRELHFQYHRDFHVWEGLAAFIHAKGAGWIPRLLAVDLESPDERRLNRMKEYVAAYYDLPLEKKQKLRGDGILMLEFIRTKINQHERGRKQSARLLDLIDAAQPHIVESMSMLGACFFLHRDYFFEIGGCDEEHGSWGQQGTEMACLAWLSGGRLVVNKATWYSHLFRTQDGFSFPYGMQGVQQQKAKEYSRNLWRNNLWPRQKYPLSYILEHFWPVPGWTNEDLALQKALEANHPKFGKR